MFFCIVFDICNFDVIFVEGGEKLKNVLPDEDDIGDGFEIINEIILLIFIFNLNDCDDDAYFSERVYKNF